MPDDEFYTRPMFHVQDVGLSIAYYCEKLGFTKSWEFAVIAQVGRDGLDLILDAGSDIPRAAVGGRGSKPGWALLQRQSGGRPV